MPHLPALPTRDRHPVVIVSDATDPLSSSAAPLTGGQSAVPSSSTMLIVIGTLMIIAALKLGQALVLPVVIAMLLTLMLSAPVRWLRRWRVPERVGAAIVVLGALGVGIGSATLLVAPAAQWMGAAPATMRKLETRIRRLSLPFTMLERSADRVQQATEPIAADAGRIVHLATPGILARVALQTTAAAPVVLSVIFLTYFLLANAALFRRKLAGLLPGSDELARREHLLGEIGVAASRYLVTVTTVNAGVGALTALALWLVGVPSPLLWGGMAAVFNFVPYLGAVVTAVIITVASLASIDATAQALLAPFVFVLIHLTESNVVTPTLLGRHLPLNTVAIFAGLLFFGWLWGISGAVLAVPLTVCAKLVCDHVPALARVGDLLDS
jgi:predicted PurR-regulated permease PerM